MDSNHNEKLTVITKKILKKFHQKTCNLNFTSQLTSIEQRVHAEKLGNRSWSRS